MNELFKTLNTYVSYEMVNTLNHNIDLAEMLLKKLTSRTDKKIAKLILITSKMMLMHANDFMDHRILEKGKFTRR